MFALHFSTSLPWSTVVSFALLLHFVAVAAVAAVVVLFVSEACLAAATVVAKKTFKGVSTNAQPYIRTNTVLGYNISLWTTLPFLQKMKRKIGQFLNL